MKRVLLTCYCAPGDADGIGLMLREAADAPIHVRREEVLGRHFDDAGNRERVSGSLSRVALEVEIEATFVDELIESLSLQRRRMPLRWRTTPILAGGRLA